MNNFRIENKYKVEFFKLDEVYKFLGNNFAKILNPKRFIKSIYFDNKNFSLYHESVEGTIPRKKIRIRTYSNENILNLDKKFNLEIKINSVEGRYKTVKKSVNHIKFLKEGILDKDYGHIFPVIEVCYYREYYQILNLRLTLDTKINYRVFNKNRSPLIDDVCIMEVKSNNVDNNNYIDENLFFMKTRFSKYCEGIESLNLI